MFWWMTAARGPVVVVSVTEWFRASFLRRPWSQGWWFNSHPNLVVASLNMMLHVNYLCLEEFNKKQIEDVRSKIQTEKSQTRATPKRVWNSGFVLFIASSSHSRDRRIKIKNHQGRWSCLKTLSIFSACYFLIKNVLCSELTICYYNIDIKDFLSSEPILGCELIAKIKLICWQLLRKMMNQIILIN